MLLPLRAIVVCVGPAPRRITLLRLARMELLSEIVPAGILTTLFAGAPANAALMFAAVGVAKAVLQAAVTQFTQVVGTPPGIPALLQAMARSGARMPNHACTNDGVEHISGNAVNATRRQ